VGVLRRGSAGSFALSGDPGRALAERDYPVGKFSVTYALKDAGVASRLAGERLPGLQAATALLRRAQAAGAGDAYYPAMAEVLLAEKPSGGQRIPLRTPAETTAAVTGTAELAPFTERRSLLAVYRAMAHDPAMLNAWLPLCDHFLVAPAITPREREVLILRTSYNCDSVYEWDKHAPKAPEVGITDAELAVLGGAPAGAELDPWLVTLISFADELHLTSTVSDETWAALGERWDDAQRTSCLMLVGQYHMLAFTLNGARITHDPADEPEGHS
jgi:4-carboxymuconolactone decarboxylase